MLVERAESNPNVWNREGTTWTSIVNVTLIWWTKEEWIEDGMWVKWSIRVIDGMMCFCRKHMHKIK